VDGDGFADNGDRIELVRDGDTVSVAGRKDEWHPPACQFNGYLFRGLLAEIKVEHCTVGLLVGDRLKGEGDIGHHPDFLRPQSLQDILRIEGYEALIFHKHHGHAGQRLPEGDRVRFLHFRGDDRIVVLSRDDELGIETRFGEVELGRAAEVEFDRLFD